MAAIVLALLLVWLGAAAAEPQSHSGARTSPAQLTATQVALVADAEGQAIVVDMSAEARAQASYMADPLRIVLDFPRLRFQAAAVPRPAADGAVAASASVPSCAAADGSSWSWRAPCKPPSSASSGWRAAGAVS